MKLNLERCMYAVLVAAAVLFVMCMYNIHSDYLASHQRCLEVLTATVTRDHQQLVKLQAELDAVRGRSGR